MNAQDFGYIDLLVAIHNAAVADLEQFYGKAILHQIDCAKGRRRQAEYTQEDATAMLWCNGLNRLPRQTKEMLATVQNYLRYCKNCKEVG